MVMVFTKNINSYEIFEKFSAIIKAIDWEHTRYAVLPSEYIEKVQILERD